MNPFLDIRIIFTIIVGLVIAYFAWDYHERGVELQKDKQTLVVDQTAIKDQKQTIQQTAKTDTITNTVNTEVAKQTTDIQKKQNAVQTKVNQKIIQIEESAIGKPDTPDLEKQLDDQVAQADLDGMWETYCNAQPGINGCPADPSVPVTPAPEEPSHNILNDLPKINLPTIEVPKIPSINPLDLLK